MSTSLKFAHSDSSSRGHMVIQCPGCHTRFSVETAAVAAVENPHFHCSKCDHLFGYETEVEPARPEQATRSEIFAKSENDFTDGIVAVYRNSSRVEPASRESNEPKPLEIPRRWDTTIKITPPRENTPEVTQMPLDFTAPPSQPVAPAYSLSDAPAPIASVSAPPREKPAATHSIREGGVEDTIEIEAFGKIKNAPLVEDGSLIRSTGSAALSTSAAKSAAAKAPLLPRALSPLREPKRATVWSHVAAPVLGFFALILLVAVALRVSDGFSRSMVRSLLPGAPEAAPSGLYLRNTKFQKVILDSGEVIRVITGTVVNNAETTFRDVEIEGALFDRGGRTLGVIRADAAATLAKAKVRSLTPEMIREMQSGKNAKRLVLHPGEDKDFALALIGSEYAQAKHFGARIYSAKQP